MSEKIKPDNDSEFLRVKEAAKMLSVSPRTV
jgi:hypothetical protein